MPIRRDDDGMISGREEEERAARRAERRHWIVALVICLAWCGAGAAVTVYGFMIHDRANGRVLVESGWLLAASGVLVTVVAAAAWRRRRGMDRGRADA